jgi:hypothetical protein
MWHTYDWPVDADARLKGKKVAYIGSGPSAVQILSRIEPSVKELKVYMRSMTYVLPMGNWDNPPVAQWLKRHVPGLLSVWVFVLGSLFSVWTYFLFRPGSWMAGLAEWYCERHLEQTVKDPVLREKLRPVGRIGAKRPLVSRSFYRDLQSPKVEVIKESLKRIDERGLFSVPWGKSKPSNMNATKEYLGTSSRSSSIQESDPIESYNSVDVIIWGTGFQMQGWGTAFDIYGEDGETLGQHWGSSPNTLYGMLPLLPLLTTRFTQTCFYPQVC